MPIESNILELLCTPERGACFLCRKSTLILRVQTDDMSDPGFCLRCLAAMFKMLAEELD